MNEIDTTNTAGRLVAAVEFVHRNMIQSADTLFEQVAEEIILLQAENEKLKAELEAHRWIPVEERLPKDQSFVMVIRKRYEDEPERSFYVADSRGGVYQTGFCRGMPVTHWKPIVLPK